MLIDVIKDDNFNASNVKTNTLVKPKKLSISDSHSILVMFIEMTKDRQQADILIVMDTSFLT